MITKVLPNTPSLDGVPFLMRDRTLRRTTDVQRLFPQRQSDDASLFTWAELRSLNAGLWFLKVPSPVLTQSDLRSTQVAYSIVLEFICLGLYSCSSE